MSRPRAYRGPRHVGVVGPIRGGSLSVARMVARALDRLGVRVTFVDNAHWQTRLTGALREAELTAPGQEEVRNRAIATVLVQASRVTAGRLQHARPDTVIYLAQSPCTDDDATATLRKQGTRCIYWFVEDPEIFSYWKGIAHRFDAFWVLNQGPETDFERALRAHGPEVRRVPLGFDASMLGPNGDPVGSVSSGMRTDSSASPHPWDVLFVGAGYPNRLHFVSDWTARLARTLGDGGTNIRYEVPSLHIRGPGFHPYEGPGVHVEPTPLAHEDLAAWFARTPVNLNLSSSVHSTPQGTAPFLNPRAFEICGAGGFQCLDARLPVDPFFEPEREVVCFSSVDEAWDKVRYFLTHDAERLAIANAGARRARTEHSYEARLDAALSM